MLRILNGGVDASPLLDAQRLEMVTGVRPDQYLDYAAFRGDSSDNLPGVPGFGPKTAAKLLGALDTAQAAFEDAAAGGERCVAAVGAARSRTLATREARAAHDLNRAAMSMVDSVALGLGLDGESGAGRLPLDVDAIRSTYERFSLDVPTAVRALALREPPRFVREPSHVVPTPAARRFPPLPRPEPVAAATSVQEPLF
jgi:DNA polymerase-1